MIHSLVQHLKNKLVISCQALPGEPLYGDDTIVKMANAVLQGGASALRLNDPETIAPIRQITDAPIIGLYKKEYNDSPIHITPALQDALAVHYAGADIIALDATNRSRPNGETLADIVSALKKKNCTLMADIDTYDNAVYAASLDIDIISTTLSGYTEISQKNKTPYTPDFDLVQRLANNIDTPIFAEGRIWTVEQAKKMFDLGAHTIVIGAAITRPKLITEYFLEGVIKQ